MAKKTSEPFHNPFEKLKSLVKKKAPESAKKQIPKPSAPKPPPKPRPMEPEDEDALFRSMMAGVTPLGWSDSEGKKQGPSKGGPKAQDPDAEVRARLDRIVRGGKGFVVSLTDEYVEGANYGVDPRLPARLHAGDFSIQAHVDLHGMTALEAEEAFDAFLKNHIARGTRAVCVVHGRGLSSPGKPVLKTKVISWLTRGPWRKWVIAFASAKGCDGGAGATYVLLRRRPVTHRDKKRKF